MTDDRVRLKATNLVKEYYIGARPRLSLKEHFLSPLHSSERKKFRAVDDMTFEVEEGEFFGIIGRNGSGKSTLLKLLAGIIEPTSGSIIANGRMVPFLELGVGFNPDLTARENIYLNGTILGMSRKTISKKFDEIVSFAEVERFIDTQIKNYSSGMYVRLAFSVAMQAEADIYIIDEILSVGDFAFQQKCFRLFKALKKSGKTFVFVSHDLGAIREFCSRAMYIKFGKIIKIGETDDVIKEYVIHDRQDSGVDIPANIFGRNTNVGGNAEVDILDEEGKLMQATITGKPLRIRMRYSLHESTPKDDLVAGFGIYKDGDTFMFGTNTLIENTKIDFNNSGVINFGIEHLPFLQGHYGISVAIHDRENNHFVWKENAVEFDVVKSNSRDGLIDMREVKIYAD